MENEKNRNYLDERRSLGENNPPNLDPENEIKSGPKKELLGSSGDAKESRNENNEVLEMMKKKRKSKDMTIPIILGVVFLIVVTVVAGFYLLKDKDIPGIGGVGPQQKILNSSMMAMNDVESYSFEGDFNLSFTEDDKEGFSLAMKFDGQADASNTDNIKSSFNIKPEIAISKEGGSEDISFDFSMKSFGKVGEEIAYFKLNDFDLGAAGMIYGEMIVPYKDKWYFFDYFKKVKEEVDNPPRFSGEIIKEVLKKYKIKIVKFQKDFGDTKLGDADVYHYQVGMDSETVLDFYVELLKIMSSEIASVAGDDSMINQDFDAELEENKEEILAVMDEVLANVKTEIWIGKKDKMIYKMAMSGNFDEEFMESLEEKMEKIEKEKRPNPESIDYSEFEDNNKYDNNTGELSFSMSITMSDFNQPINISKPEEAEDLMKVLEEAMAGVMGGMMSPGISSGDDSDQDGLNDEMEEFYGTDPNNPDTDGDGHNDGNEVSRGYNPLLPGEAKLDYDRLFKY